MSIGPVFGAPSRRRAVAVSAVAGAHLAVLLVVWQMKLAPTRAQDSPRVISLRLLPDRSARREREVASARGGVAARVALERPVSAAPPEAVVRSIVAPLPSEASAPPSVADDAAVLMPGTGRVGLDGSAAPGAAGRAASGTQGLALVPGRAVLRGSLANPAVNDPRSSTPRLSLEERLAMGLDPTLCVKEERLPDGSVRRFWSHYAEVQSRMSATHGKVGKPVLVCQ